jgi:uncharacterized membrane protein YhaH (DUF805 family)
MPARTHEHTADAHTLRTPEKGLLSFIKTKLEHSVHPKEIKQMLIRAGFADDHIDHAFKYVRQMYDDTHQDLVAINDFLPPLSKSRTTTDKAIDRPTGHKGLFVGRLRRKDFVLGFLFFFGIGYVTFAFSALLLSQVAPDMWQYILATIASDSNNFLMMLVPVILAPITVISLSLIVRRLHNLGLPGGLAFLFLMWFLPAFNQVNGFGFFALEFALLVLFVALVTVKGSPAPNKYGPLPESKGSFFRRILNI